MEVEWGTVIHMIGSHVMINTSARLQLRAVVIEKIKERRKKSPLLICWLELSSSWNPPPLGMPDLLTTPSLPDASHPGRSPQPPYRQKKNLFFQADE